MTKRIVSGIFILTALGALGVILAGALTSGEQLIVRFLTAVIVAALGLYVISDLRLQADDDAMTTRSNGHSRMAKVDAPPNSTAAFMATVTRRSDQKATESGAEAADRAAAVSKEQSAQRGFGLADAAPVSENPLVDRNVEVDDARSGEEASTGPIAAVSRPNAPDTVRTTDAISRPPEISLTELFNVRGITSANLSPSNGDDIESDDTALGGAPSELDRIEQSSDESTTIEIAFADATGSLHESELAAAGVNGSAFNGSYRNGASLNGSLANGSYNGNSFGSTAGGPFGHKPYGTDTSDQSDSDHDPFGRSGGRPLAEGSLGNGSMGNGSPGSHQGDSNRNGVSPGGVSPGGVSPGGVSPGGVSPGGGSTANGAAKNGAAVNGRYPNGASFRSIDSIEALTDTAASAPSDRETPIGHGTSASDREGRDMADEIDGPRPVASVSGFDDDGPDHTDLDRQAAAADQDDRPNGAIPVDGILEGARRESFDGGGHLGGATDGKILSEFEYSDEVQAPQYEWPAPAPKVVEPVLPENPFERASAAYQAETERLARTTDSLPVVAPRQELEAADYADAPLAPIIDLRGQMNLQHLSGVDGAIKAGEVEVIATLIEQGMLSTDGPISDRDVRTMVYVAFTSNELRKLLLAGGTPDGPNHGLDLGPVELFDERIHAPAPKTLYAGLPRQQVQSQLG